MSHKQLVRPTGSVIVGYRFSHQLIRDTAYQGMLKRGRARLHERYADWLAAHEADRIGEVEEVIGYHLEQAYLHLQGLGPLDEHGRALAERAASLLREAGTRAFAREDMHAAVSLLRRAVDLMPEPSSDRLSAQLLLAEALDETGVYGEAGIVLDDVEATAAANGDATSAARSRLLRLRVDLSTSAGAEWASRALAEAERDLPIFEAAGDLAGASLAWRVRYLAHGITGHPAEAATDAENVIELAVQAHDERQRLRGISNLAIALTYGPTPAADAADRLARLSAEVGADRTTGVVLAAWTAQLLAMRLQFEEARTLYEQARNTARELGQPVLAAQLAFNAGEVELRAGDAARAESILREAEEVLTDVGDSFFLASVAAMRGQALVELGNGRKHPRRRRAPEISRPRTTWMRSRAGGVSSRLFCSPKASVPRRSHWRRVPWTWHAARTNP